jgi:hypothetical protein
MGPVRATLPVFLELPKQDATMSTSTKDSAHRVEPKNDAHSGATTKSSSGQANPSSPAGRIVHDSRGNAVWSWDKGGDAAAEGSTSKMLKKLDLGDLRMEDDAQPEQQVDTKKRASNYGPGYNPYDRTVPVRVTTPKK